MAESNPLDRRPGESRWAHRALMDYCEMGAKRSLRDLWVRYQEGAKRWQEAQQKGQGEVQKPPTRQLSRLKKWSVHHEWVKRAHTYDEWQLQLKGEEKLKAIEEQARREITGGQALMASGERVVREIVQRIADGRLTEADWGDLQDMWPWAMRAMVEGSKLIRLGTGEPTEIQKHILAMGPDELLEFIRRGMAGLGGEGEKG